jgi:integrase
VSARYSGVTRSLVVTWRVSGSKRQAMMVEKLTAHLGPVGEADAWVFTADKGGVLRPSNFRVKVWLAPIPAAGLVPLRPHDLRHTAVAL